MDTNRKSELISLEVPIDIKDERKSFRCPQCKYVTDRKNNLKRHIITMHQESSKSLECCGVIFKSKALLRDHVSLFHRGGYCCQICGRNFCRKALLHRHLTVHSGQKDFSCSQCGYATSHKSNLERHQKVHFRCGEGTFGLLDNSSDSEHRLYRENYLTDIKVKAHRQRTFSSSSRRHCLLPKRLIHTYQTAWKLESSIESRDNLENDNGSNVNDIVMDKDENMEDLNGLNEYSEIGIETEHVQPKTGGNSLRLTQAPYKCNICKNYFKIQIDFLNHRCVSRDRSQPTLPLTNAFRKKSEKTGDKMDENVTESPQAQKVIKPSIIEANSTRNRKRRFTDSTIPIPRKVSRQDNQPYPLINYAKYRNYSTKSPESFCEGRTLSDSTTTPNVLNDSDKTFHPLDSFTNKDSCVNFCRFPFQKFPSSHNFYPLHPFTKERVNNFNFWRVW